jgi:uncharacterized protein (TIGR03435 family)
MLDLIRIACKMPPEAVLGGPNWLEFDRFDIAANAPAQSSPETVRGMLQSLLVDRFHLAVHNEMHPMPAYVLSIGKTKPKLTESSGASQPGCRYVQPPAGSTVVAYSCRKLNMAAYASELRSMGSEYLKEPVIDQTGLEGAWDFALQMDSPLSGAAAADRRKGRFPADPRPNRPPGGHVTPAASAGCKYSCTVPSPIEQLRAIARSPRPTENFNRRTSLILRTDNLLPGNQSSLSQGGYPPLCCPAPIT